MADFIIPSFLEKQSVDEIHERMMNNLPDNIDTSEGSHPWNLTYPSAYEKAYMSEFLMTEAIKLIFPQFCEDYAEIMEYHAEIRNMTRKPAKHATGEITITAPADTEIPAGSTFSTIGINDEPSIDFVTTENAVIGVTGNMKIPIRAVQSGIVGNVPAGTIVLNSSEIDSITAVTNEKDVSGGIEIETIEALQTRIREHDTTMEQSYGGAPSDYKRWALEVPGTGSAIIVAPASDSEKITIILTDSAGNPANSELCTAVYNHIMRPDNPQNRLAPINDQITVVPPSTLALTITATVELAAGATVTQAKDAFVAAMQKYIIEAANDGEIRYTKVGSVLSSVAVVNDYKDLKINGGTVNIALSNSQVPTIDKGNVALTDGTV